VQNSELTNYVQNSELTNYVQNSELTNYVQNKAFDARLSDKADKSALKTVLPAQGGMRGGVLSTDGHVAKWAHFPTLPSYRTVADKWLKATTDGLIWSDLPDPTQVKNDWRGEQNFSKAVLIAKTPITTDSSDQVATTAYVSEKIKSLSTQQDLSQFITADAVAEQLSKQVDSLVTQDAVDLLDKKLTALNDVVQANHQALLNKAIVSTKKHEEAEAAREEASTDQLKLSVKVEEMTKRIESWETRLVAAGSVSQGLLEVVARLDTGIDQLTERVANNKLQLNRMIKRNNRKLSTHASTLDEHAQAQEAFGEDLAEMDGWSFGDPFNAMSYQ
ncbi:MAG: hypothetical protein N0E59_02205, partial [Candidatus Thiodiazotropha taylori]|nr:hypothetical protein [Candidatus Thiodiazotropha taylori]MCW4281896.1 hypothetical protein [Candidatus Thiodiazotropha taylori]